MMVIVCTAPVYIIVVVLGGLYSVAIGAVLLAPRTNTVPTTSIPMTAMPYRRWSDNLHLRRRYPTDVIVP